VSAHFLSDHRRNVEKKKKREKKMKVLIPKRTVKDV
jgi:hypothetical protein